jgi:hypothetical protein
MTNNSRDINYLGSGRNFKIDLKLYGKHNFKKYIIDYCDSQLQADEQEIYWIKFYNSRNKAIGYNVSPGGHNGDVISMHPERERICKAISNGLKTSEKAQKYYKSKERSDILRNAIKNSEKHKIATSTLEFKIKVGDCVRKSKKYQNAIKDKIFLKRRGKAVKDSHKYRLFANKTDSCIYCRTICNIANLTRWHNNNCKLKKQKIHATAY